MTQLEQEMKKTLTYWADSNNMSLKEVAQLANMMINRDMILKQHQSPISQDKRDKRWRTRLPNGKQIVKTRREDLLDAIVEHYSSSQQKPPEPAWQLSPPPQGTQGHTDGRTLQSIYPEWLSQRKSEVCRNTLADDIRNWEKYIAPSTIASMPLSQLTKSKLKTWACQLITENSMKKKYYDNIRTVLNSLLNYAVDAEYLDANKFKDIRINSRLYRPAAFKEENEEAFTRQEQALVMQAAEEDSQETNSALPLGICILFLTGMRVGELCGLKHGDIDDKGKKLYIRRMVVAKQIDTPTGLKSCGYEIVEHAKTTAGQRSIPLTGEVRAYFRKIRELNEQNGFPVSDEDLVFQRKQGMCNQRVFDSRLKKYCSPSHLNLPFAKSCHDVRRSFISHLFDMGLNPDEIRRIAGHENIEMTMRYCRGRSSLEELAEILEQDSRSRRAQQGVTRV